MKTMPKQKPGKSKQNYRTPKEFLNAALRYVQATSWTFDFASDRSNHVASAYWTEKTDSLSKQSKEWAAHIGVGWGWLNPPYADIEPWVIKCALLNNRHRKIAFLVPASVGSNWYRDYIDQEPGVEVLFCSPRISFDGKAPYPKDCMLVLFHGDNRPFTTKVWTR